MDDLLLKIVVAALTFGAGVATVYLREFAKRQATADAKIANLETTARDTEAKKQGEYNAILKNLDTIRLKVEVTETAAVQIKEDLAHEKWWEREDRVLRRTKIEELVTAAMESLQSTTNFTLTSRTLQEYATLGPWFRVWVIAMLYFPTLSDDASELVQAGQQLMLAALSKRDYDDANRGGEPSSAEGRVPLQAAYDDAANNVRVRVSIVAAKSVAIMNAILAKPESILDTKP